MKANKSKKPELLAQISAYQIPALKSLEILSLKIESRALKGNPLGDPYQRSNPILCPKGSEANESLPLIVVLPGFAGSGEKFLAWKSFEDNFVQQLDRCLAAKLAPRARYLLVDAYSFWGGSQYINSRAVGRYEDYLVQELVPAVKNIFASNTACVMGASSGGYGALHLASAHPNLFQICAAFAPDAAFDLCYGADLRMAAPLLATHSLSKLKNLHREGGLHSKKNGFPMLNAIAMSACYSPKESGRTGEFEFPIDFITAEFKLSVWRRWQELDPVKFLPRRRRNVRKLKNIYLEVGNRDEFSLHFGARRLRRVLEAMGARLEYREFEGGHFDFAGQRPLFWKWLAKKLAAMR